MITRWSDRKDTKGCWLPSEKPAAAIAFALSPGYFFLISRFEWSESTTVLGILNPKWYLEWLTFEIGIQIDRARQNFLVFNDHGLGDDEHVSTYPAYMMTTTELNGLLLWQSLNDIPDTFGHCLDKLWVPFRTIITWNSTKTPNGTITVT